MSIAAWPNLKKIYSNLIRETYKSRYSTQPKKQRCFTSKSCS